MNDPEGQRGPAEKGRNSLRIRSGRRYLSPRVWRDLTVRGPGARWVIDRPQGWTDKVTMPLAAGASVWLIVFCLKALEVLAPLKQAPPPFLISACLLGMGAILLKFSLLRCALVWAGEESLALVDGRWVYQVGAGFVRSRKVLGAQDAVRFEQVPETFRHSNTYFSRRHTPQGLRASVPLWGGRRPWNVGLSLDEKDVEALLKDLAKLPAGN